MFATVAAVVCKLCWKVTRSYRYIVLKSYALSYLVWDFKSRYKQLKIPTILLGQQQCSVCDSVMSLVSKKQLAQLETIKKYLEPHKKIIDVKKREDAVKRIKEKHFGDNNSLTKVYGFWHGKGGLAKSFWLYFIGYYTEMNLDKTIYGRVA